MGLMIPKQQRIQDTKHLHFMASLPCVVCASPFTVAHHLLRSHEHGMSRKSGDDKTIPLCPQHHGELHAAGDETKYLGFFKIDGPTLARALWEATGDLEICENIVRYWWEQAA